MVGLQINQQGWLLIQFNLDASRLSPGSFMFVSERRPGTLGMVCYVRHFSGLILIIISSKADHRGLAYFIPSVVLHLKRKSETSVRKVRQSGI